MLYFYTFIQKLFEKAKEHGIELAVVVHFHMKSSEHLQTEGLQAPVTI